MYIRITPSSSLVVNVVPVAFHYPLACHEQHPKRLTSTIPILAPPFSNSATTSAFHPSLDVSSGSSPSFGGSTLHILTAPSRAPVAMRWYDRPQDGAHETDVRGDEEGGVR